MFIVDLKFSFVFFAFLFFSCSIVFGAESARVGVYYFPGWKSNTPYAPSQTPWERIKPFDHRKPLLGWYEEGRGDVLASQLGWMRDYGFSFVIFDWYFGKNRKENLAHVINQYLMLAGRRSVGFSILWANHESLPESMEDWVSIVSIWLDRYFSDRDYLRVGEKPVVFILSQRRFSEQASSFGEDEASLLRVAQSLARKKGFSGIHFVVGLEADNSIVASKARDIGYSAFSAYNWHRGPKDRRVAYSYRELDDGYRRQWEYFHSGSSLPLVTPMTVGWDRKPWGGSDDPKHDGCTATPAEFQEHLKAAREFVGKEMVAWARKDPGLAGLANLAVLCCWNEYGEGSVVEPTEAGGFSYLSRFRSVFRSE